MNRTMLHHLYRVEPPWITLAAVEADREKWITSHFYSRPTVSVCARRLRGQKMRTTADLMNEFGAAFQFPDAFGENWYALEECLQYLDEWLPADAYIVEIANVEHLLRAEGPDELASFLNVVHAVGEWWAQPVTGNGRFDRSPAPFHVLLQMASGDDGVRVRRAAAKGAIPVRQL